MPILIKGPIGNFINNFYSVSMLYQSVNAYTMWVQFLQTPKEDTRSPGTGIIESCEPPSKYWEANPGP